MGEEEEPAKWRLIITDTELPTGVAPVCPLPEVHGMMHGGPAWDELYDECCATVGPHLECWSMSAAREVLNLLNRHFVEVCS
jgi:hypothetical protein